MEGNELGAVVTVMTVRVTRIERSTCTPIYSAPLVING